MRPGVPLALASRASAKSGAAPALLLDVQTPFGDVFYWADRKLVNIPPAITPTATPITNTAGSGSSTEVPVSSVYYSPQLGYLALHFPEPVLLAEGTTVTLSGFTSVPAFNGVTGALTLIAANDYLGANMMAPAGFDAAGTEITDVNGIATVASANAPGPGTSVPSSQGATYQPWLLGSGSLNFYRSLQTDTMTLTLQNLSGDVLQSDWEKIVRKATLEGSLYVFRYYAVDLGIAWIEQHGTLSVGDTTRTSAQLNLSQLLQGQDDTPTMQVGENCQLIWGQRRCSATGPTECLYTFASCQVAEHFVGIQTSFEVNNPSAVANVPAQVFNRKRSW